MTLTAEGSNDVNVNYLVVKSVKPALSVNFGGTHCIKTLQEKGHLKFQLKKAH